jgi:hypothetical protein
MPAHSKQERSGRVDKESTTDMSSRLPNNSKLARQETNYSRWERGGGEKGGKEQETYINKSK